MLPDGTPLSVRVVDRSLIALQELQVAVGEGRHALRAAGADVSSVSVDVASNRVEVGLADYTEQAADVVMSAFPGVDVSASPHPELDACTDIESCGPGMKGGLRINRYGEPTHNCPAGYIARRNDNVNDLVLVTAGHCFAGGSTVTWQHAGNHIGSEVTAYNGWHDGSLADVAMLDLYSAAMPTTKDQVVTAPTTGGIAQVDSSYSFNGQIEGMQVCRIGAGSYDQQQAGSSYYRARKCGQIVRFDSDSDGTGDRNSQSCTSGTCRWIRDMKVVDFDSFGGDSGGSVFEKEPIDAAGINLLGSHVHSVDSSAANPRGWYSTVERAMNEFANQGVDIDVCYTADCSGAVW